MDYSYILNSSVPNLDKLLKFGFIFINDKYVLKHKLDNDFYVLVEFTFDNIFADVYENITDEKYALFNVLSAQGAFVGNIRTEVKNLMDKIQAECFETQDLTKKYILWIEEHFGIKGEFPWDDMQDAEVFRCPNGKWLGLIMEIPFNKLGIKSDELVHVVNLKYDADLIPQLVDRKSVFPAWHMNKKYWVTVLLTNVTDFEKLCKITNRSYELVMKK